MKKGDSPTSSNQEAATSKKSTKSKEPFQYTPAWLTPEEKAKMRARVMKLRKREKGAQMKEEAPLLKAPPPETDPDRIERKGSGTSTTSVDSKNKAKKTKSDTKMGKSTGKGEPEKSKSKESIKKKKSTDSLKSDHGKNKKKDSRSKKDKDKGKPKDELAMSKKKHPKEPHANPSGNVMSPQKEREIDKHNLEHHLWATDYANFNPQLYHFKSPEKLSTKNPVIAECPPFWVLLDHTIAVMWKMFSPQADRNDLGIVPLQWSREFVSAMRDERGIYLPAIAHVLNAIEDALLDRYSKTMDLEEASDQGEKHKEGENRDKKGKKKLDKDQAKEKDQTAEKDNMAYVSSESIFKHPFEVSYTLKDIMSRNLPGRMKPAGDEPAVKGKTQAVPKVEVSALPSSVAGMKKEDLLNYLKQLKEEQEARVEKEKDYASKIDALMEIIRKDKISPEEWIEALDKSKKPDHVQFDEGVEGEHKPVHRVRSKDKSKGKDSGDDSSVPSFESAHSSSAVSDDSRPGSVSSTSTVGSTGKKAKKTEKTSESNDKKRSSEKMAKSKSKSKSKSPPSEDTTQKNNSPEPD